MTKKAFTLIELLIVVAIIAILAAIAVPNFLEAQVRAKVSRAKSDLRSMATALESYIIDYNSYPRMNNFGNSIAYDGFGANTNNMTLERLSTPVAYITNAGIEDPFQTDFRYSSSTFNGTPADANTGEVWKYYKYAALSQNPGSDDAASSWDQADDTNPKWWALECVGPDRAMHNIGGIVGANFNIADGDNVEDMYDIASRMIYDTTNGTTSRGSIWRVGGGPADPGAVMFETMTAGNN